MYFLQIDKDTGIYSPDVAVAADHLSCWSWQAGESLDTRMRFVDIRDLESHRVKENGQLRYPDNVIPVGSIEYCEKVLDYPLAAINIPMGLRDPLYTGRQVADARPETLPSLFDRFKARHLFIKSASRTKCDYTGIYGIKRGQDGCIRITTEEGIPLPEDTYFVSEVVSLLAEWRCFVRNGTLIDIKQYAGSYTTLLTQADIQMVRNIIIAVKAEFGPRMSSFVVDVGKVNDKKRELPIVIEIHNFICCGLYGFDDENLLPMLRDGIFTERAFRCGIEDSSPSYSDPSTVEEMVPPPEESPPPDINDIFEALDNRGE